MTLNGPDFELTITADTIDVTPLTEPDPAWCYRDKSRHVHRWTFFKRKAAECKTVLWVIDGYHYCEDGDKRAYGHHECRRCGERIEPGYRDGTRRDIVSRRDCTGSFFVPTVRRRFFYLQRSMRQCRAIYLKRWNRRLSGVALVTSILQEGQTLCVEFVPSGTVLRCQSDDGEWVTVMRKKSW